MVCDRSDCNNFMSYPSMFYEIYKIYLGLRDMQCVLLSTRSAL